MKKYGAWRKRWTCLSCGLTSTRLSDVYDLCYSCGEDRGAQVQKTVVRPVYESMFRYCTFRPSSWEVRK